MSREHDECGSALGFVLGMVFGGIIGAAVGVLMAPKPGSETREDLKGLTEDLKVKANKFAKDMSECSEDFLKKSKEVLESAKGKIQQAVKTGKPEECCSIEQPKEEAAPEP
jgi:gas vesicle protein